MPKFRKKPVVIEAVQFDGSALKAAEIEAWSGGKCCYTDSDGMVIDTLEGRLYVSDDDWVIRGVQGEFYPCKPDIFALTYDEVTE
jgi:hypothetical protein